MENIKVYDPWKYFIGPVYAKKLIIAHLKFKFNWELCILSGNTKATFPLPTFLSKKKKRKKLSLFHSLRGIHLFIVWVR